MEGLSTTRRILGRWALVALTATAIWLPGCSGFKGTTAASFLRNIKESPDPNLRYVSYAKLASPQCYDNEQQKEDAVRLLVAKLEEGKEPVATRAMICRTLGELHNRAARGVIANAVSDNEGIVRAQACRALGKVGTAEDATVLTRVMTVDTLEDCRIAAIEGLGELKSDDPRIMGMLIGGMDHDDPAIRHASYQSLRAITRKDLGIDPAEWRKALEPQLAAKAPSDTGTIKASNPAPASAPAPR